MANNNLFTPLQIRGLELKNRIVVSPMQQYSATDGLVNNWHLVHLGSRAVGGAALIITEATAVSPRGMNTPNDTGIWNDEQVNAWKNVVQFVHEQGAKIAVQLWHSGAKGSHSHPRDGMKYISAENGGWLPKSASPIKLDDTYHSEALSVEEIADIRSSFVNAAMRAVTAGFDSIELHAGHGYLFHQFYSSYVNRRDDEYGGSFERRIGLLVETVKQIRQVIPEDMPLFVRISAVDYLEDDDAWRIEDSVKLSRILKENGVDVITASAGGFVFLDKSRVYPSYQVPFAEKIKSETGIITGAVGAITSPEQANEIITSNKADLAVIAREFLRDPYFPLRAAAKLEKDIPVPFQYKRAF
ncbi:NADH:flavin oxidoreductase/NADH oxidase [Mucilaginibacter angelicae]|uniref:NADH:flavin oxidoreductase/NADH oxidase n=1 Tax=Mucilaginibacter angelicae TaxID=869718 RepID=A0ABV6L064_9SPHI